MANSDKGPGAASVAPDYRVLVVDDDETMRYLISRVIGRCGCAVESVESPTQALAVLASEKVDLVFADLTIPGTEGGEGLLQRVMQSHQQTNVILMSSAISEEERQAFIQQGAFDCLRKPFFEQECQDILTRLGNPEIYSLRRAS